MLFSWRCSMLLNGISCHRCLLGQQGCTINLVILCLLNCTFWHCFWCVRSGFTFAKTLVNHHVRKKWGKVVFMINLHALCYEKSLINKIPESQIPCLVASQLKFWLSCTWVQLMLIPWRPVQEVLVSFSPCVQACVQNLHVCLVFDISLLNNRIATRGQ